VSQYRERTRHYRFVNFLGLLLSTLMFVLITDSPPISDQSCLLCSLARLSLLSTILLFALAWLHNPYQTGQRIYATLTLLFTAPALAVTGQYLWHSSQQLQVSCNRLVSEQLISLASYLPIDPAVADQLSRQSTASCNFPPSPFSAIELPWLLAAALLLLSLLSWIQLTRRSKERSLFLAS